MGDIEKPIQATTGENAIKAVTTALNAIPWAGGVLSDVANWFITERQNHRLNEFILDLAEKLQTLNARINRDFVRTEEFKNLVEEVFSKAAEARQHEKLEALRNIFLNTALSNKPNYNEAIEVVELITRWQPRHIILMKILSDPVLADEQLGKVVGDGGHFLTSINQILGALLPEWDEDQIERTWQDLYDVKIHRTPGTRTMITDRGIHQLENRLTEFGMKVADYLKTKNHESFAGECIP